MFDAWVFHGIKTPACLASTSPMLINDFEPGNNTIKTKKEITMKILSLMKLVAVFFVLFLLVSCGGKQTETEQAEAPSVEKLNKKYDNILFSPFTAKAEINKDYPEAADTLQHSMMTALKTEKRFKKVGSTAQNKTSTDKTLLIKADITELRIVGGAARMWGGAFAGSSGVELDLQLVDGATNKVVRKEKMSSWNSAWAASWTGGTSDTSLLDDMGKILAKYIVDSMPEK